MTLDKTAALAEAFVARWEGAGSAERANYQLFLAELCDVLGVPRPEPATGSAGPYRFERGVTHYEADGSTSNRRIDLYRQDCFVLEAKQGGDAAVPQASLFPAPNEALARAQIRNSPGWARHMLPPRDKRKGMCASCRRARPRRRS